MAREIRFDLVIDGVGESIKDFDKLNNEIDQTEKSLGNVGSNKDLDKLGSSFDKAAKGFTTAAKGISGAVNLAAGSIGLLGVESAKVQETLLKVQSALALTTGLKDFSEFLAESAVATKLASVAQAAYAAVVGTSTGALKAFRLALVATGIGALVVGIGLLILNFDKVIEVIDSAIDRFKEMGTLGKIIVTPLVISLTPLIAIIKGIQLALEELGIIESKSEKENKKLNEERTKRYAAEKKQLDDLNNKKLEDIDKEIALNRSLGKSVDALIIKRKEEEIAIQDVEKKRAEIYLFFLERAGIARQADRDYVAAAQKESDKLYFELTLLQNEFSRVILENLNKEAEVQKKNAEDAKERRRLEAEEKKKQGLLEFQRFEKELAAKKKAQDDADNQRKAQIEKELRDDEIDIEIKLLNIEKGSEEELDLLINKLQLESDIKIAAAGGDAKEIELINQQFFAAVAKLDEDFRKGIKDRDKKTLDEKRADITGFFNSLGGAFGLIRGPLENIGAIFEGVSVNASRFTDSITNAVDTFTTEGATLEDKVNAIAGSITAGLEIFGQALDQVAQASEENSDARIARLERETTVQSAQLDAQFRKGLLTEQQLANARIKLNFEQNKLIEKERKKEFKKQKKLRIASATIDMIQGAVTAFAGAFQLGPIAGPIVGGILSAAVLAFGAVNIAKIAKQRYEGSEASAESPPSITLPSPPTGGADSSFNRDRSGSTNLFPVNSGAVGGANNIEGLGAPSGSGKTDNNDRRVFVVESDITRVQNRVTAIDDRSTIV